MTIKAVLRNGQIEPLEPLPTEWADGQELVVETDSVATNAQLANWMTELDTSVADLPAADHQQFQQALDEIERESKESVRRQWDLR
jgi:hypothetical protein